MSDSEKGPQGVHPLPPAPEQAVAPKRDYAQFGLAAALAVLAVVLLVSTSGLRTDFAEIDPVGPKLFPRIVAVGLLVCAALLAIATARGSVPEPEEGEDVDLSQGLDWRTFGALVLAFVFLIVTVNFLGWTISSALFFAFCTQILGGRSWILDLGIGAALGLASFYLFYVGLGVPLPAGILDGIL